MRTTDGHGWTRILGRAVFADELSQARSAKRINMNSRGRKPTEQRRANGRDPERVEPCQNVRPFQGRIHLRLRPVGFTHGYSCSSPPANFFGDPCARVCIRG